MLGGKVNPKGSGLLRGGGGIRYFPPRQRRYRFKREPEWAGLRLSDWERIRKEVPDYDDNIEYSRRELMLLTEKILIEDDKPFQEAPIILLAPHFLERVKREVYCSAGTPDPSIVSGLYWRTHPRGRAWRTPSEMKATAGSFYK